jgi:hypothetical protein
MGLKFSSTDCGGSSVTICDSQKLDFGVKIFCLVFFCSQTLLLDLGAPVNGGYYISSMGYSITSCDIIIYKITNPKIPKIYHFQTEYIHNKY